MTSVFDTADSVLGTADGVLGPGSGGTLVVLGHGHVVSDERKVVENHPDEEVQQPVNPDCISPSRIQGYLAHTKERPSRHLQ